MNSEITPKNTNINSQSRSETQQSEPKLLNFKLTTQETNSNISQQSARATIDNSRVLPDVIKNSSSFTKSNFVNGIKGKRKAPFTQVKPIPKYLLTNFHTPDVLRQQPPILKKQQDSEQVSKYSNSNDSLLQVQPYKLQELFDHQPVLPEKVINFSQTTTAPDSDPLLIALKVNNGDKWTEEYYKQHERIKNDLKLPDSKWCQISRLVMSRRLRNDMLQRAEDYTSEQEVLALKRQNLPFYYTNQAQLAQVLDAQRGNKIDRASDDVVNRLISEYDDVMNEVIKKYPGNLNLQQTQYDLKTVESNKPNLTLTTIKNKLFASVIKKQTEASVSENGNFLSLNQPNNTQEMQQANSMQGMMLIEETPTHSENEQPKILQVPKKMQSFLNYVRYPNEKFRSRSIMHRFKKMVFTFDHSDNYYSKENYDDDKDLEMRKVEFNRHRRSSHVDKALQRLDTGITNQELVKLKETFTEFRHLEGCPLTDTSKFSALHSGRRSDCGDTTSRSRLYSTQYGTNAWRKKGSIDEEPTPNRHRLSCEQSFDISQSISTSRRHQFNQTAADLRITPRTVLTESIQKDQIRIKFDQQIFASTVNSIAEESRNDQMQRVGLTILPGINKAAYFKSTEFT